MIEISSEKTRTVNVKLGIDAINTFVENTRTPITKIKNKDLYKFLENWVVKKLKVDRNWITENGVDLQLRYIIVPVLMEKLKERKVLSEFSLTEWVEKRRV